MSKHYIDNETVHNWRARYRSLPYFADLSPAALAAMDIAYERQYAAGTTCTEEAKSVVAQFPAEFVYQQ